MVGEKYFEFEKQYTKNECGNKKYHILFVSEVIVIMNQYNTYSKKKKKHITTITTN